MHQRCLGVPFVPGGLPAEPVDGPVAGGGDDPAGRAGRHAGAGQRRTASVNASWTASSASVDVTEEAHQDRDGPAVLLPEHVRDLGHQPASVQERPHLDRQRGGGGEPATPRQGRVQVGRLDDGEPAEVLLALGERAVGDQHVTVVRPQHGRRVGRVQARRRTPTRRPPSCPGSTLPGHGRWWPAPPVPGGTVGLVDAEQVLLHFGSSMSAVTHYTNGPPADRHRASGRVRNRRCPGRRPSWPIR